MRNGNKKSLKGFEKFKGFRIWREKLYEKHMEQHRHRAEYEKHQQEFMKLHKEFQLKRAELQNYQKHIERTRVIIIILIIAIWYLIFRFAGFRALSVGLALLISIGGVIGIFFNRRIEKTVLKPISKLKAAVEEISKGNYDVRVESKSLSEIDVLIDSFNEMAKKLGEVERLKAEYEDNRKALVANISHDMKTPITSIQGYIEAIVEMDTISEADLKKYLRIIASNTTYMNKLIDDLFLFSKLDMQKLEMEFMNVRIKPCLRDMVEEFRLELEDKKIETRYVDDLQVDTEVYIDLKRLYQVFRNIIGNAVKYGEEEGLVIAIRLFARDDRVCVSIEDNGPGIQEDRLPYIFNRFYRIDSARTKDLMSTGLGLAIAKELVDAHNGTIEVSSVEKKGSCFTISLPVAMK